MSRSFLSSEELQKIQNHLSPPLKPVSGRLEEFQDFSSHHFSDLILQKLISKWRNLPAFEKSGPVLVGSGARGELCPRSDLDLLLVGEEQAAAQFVRSCQEQGLKVRARIPLSREDWTEGVEAPDILALWEGKGLTPWAQQLLDQQKTWIDQRSQKERRAWLRKMRKDRRLQEERFDSIANLLEPNLKYGPGGLRDLDQGRQVLRLFPERFLHGEGDRARQVFRYYAGLWTLLRQKLHIDGQGDLLTGPSQFDLSRWFSMQHKDLMREIQRGLSRVHFYSTWVFEQAMVTTKELSRVESFSLETPEALVTALEEVPGILMQHRVRQRLKEVFPDVWIERKHKERGALLERVLRPGASDAFVLAAFQSRLLDRLEPEFKPLVGYVQHDQYHRYTADVHLQQACREFQKALQRPRRLGVLSREVRDLSSHDRKVLGFAMLFHDLMKGREGDHSERGRELVRTEFQRFGWSEAASEDVQWLVQNHLILSQAAFRKNPSSPSTWAELQRQGASGSALRRLAVFTALDIMASNPEAWTDWKARLLSDLLKAIRSPTAQSYFKMGAELEKRGLQILPEALDGYLVSRLSASRLADDILKASLQSGDLLPEVWRLRNGDLWIRLHQRNDQIGFVSDAVQRFFSLGIGVRHAAIATIPGVGIYDWFQVSSTRTPLQIRQLLISGTRVVKPLPEIKFQMISMVSQDDSEWVFSFKGIDRPGCLAVAAQALAQHGLSILNARVHTWGRQIDDVFGVRPQGDPVALLRQLKLDLESE